MLLLHVLQQLHAQLILLQLHITIILQVLLERRAGRRYAGAHCAVLRRPCCRAATLTGACVFSHLLLLLVSAVAVSVRLLLSLLLLTLQEQR